MKLLFTAIAAMLSLSCIAQSADEKAILEVMRKEEQTWNAGDIEGYVNLYAPEDSTRMILTKGVAAGKPAILAFYKKYWPKERMGQLTLQHDSLERLSDIYYYTSGYFSVKMADGKTVGGRFSGLMKKVNGKWYLYTDHAG